MLSEERDFTFRINLEAQFPDDYEGSLDEYAWTREWETQFPGWKAHVRNRGKSPTEEIEVALVRDFSKPHLP
jgi:hypothetical protein